MQTSLASKIGRPDLAVAPVDRYMGTLGGGLQSSASVSAGSSSLNIEGRLTAGVMLVALAVVVGFYIWTRDIQA